MYILLRSTPVIQVVKQPVLWCNLSSDGFPSCVAENLGKVANPRSNHIMLMGLEGGRQEQNDKGK